MTLLIQDVIVTAAAIGAISIVLGRLFGLFRPAGTKPQCSSCPSSRGSCDAPKQPATTGASAPLIILSQRRS